MDRRDFLKKSVFLALAGVAAPELLHSQSQQRLPLRGKKICIDAGHGLFTKALGRKKERIAPNSTEVKPAFVSGIEGVATKISEGELNLKVALKLKKKLIDLGATVIMTRETATTNMSNIDRAELANKNNVDLTIRIHANGSMYPEDHGALLVLPSGKYITDKEMLKNSEMAGGFIFLNVLKETRAKSWGSQYRSDMTGFNWSKRPVIILEMGFMSNPEEDKLLNTRSYQDKIVNGISNGLLEYIKQKDLNKSNEIPKAK